MRKTLNTAGDQRDYAQADAPNAHGPLANGRTCRYNGGTAQALGSAVLSGSVTLHRGMAGWHPPCPAADCASFLYYTAVFQNMQQGFFGFLGFAPPSGSLRGGMGEAGAFFDYMAPSCRERRPRRSAQQNSGFRITSGESAAAPLPAADAPTNADVGRIRKRVADSPNVVPCRGCCCAERASPFPTGGRVRIRRGLDHAFCGCCGGCRGRHPLQGGTDADSPGVCPGRGCCCAACRVGTPYIRAGSDSPGVGSCLWQVLRGMSRTPSPTIGRVRFFWTACLNPPRRRRLPDGPAGAVRFSENVWRIRSRPFLPPAGEGGSRRSPARRMTEEGEPHRLRAVKSLHTPLRLRSFPHCGPVMFSLSGRPCGRHPPPLGEGRGEGAFDERHVRRIRSRPIVGKGLALSAHSTWTDMGNSGRIRFTFANSPGVGGDWGVSCRKGQAPSLRGGACEFALSCGKRRCCCAACRVGTPYGWVLAGSPGVCG